MGGLDDPRQRLKQLLHKPWLLWHKAPEELDHLDEHPVVCRAHQEVEERRREGEVVPGILVAQLGDDVDRARHHARVGIVEAGPDGIVAEAEALGVLEEHLVQAEEGLLANVRTWVLEQVEQVRECLPPKVLGDNVREAANGESSVVHVLAAPGAAACHRRPPQFLLQEVRSQQDHGTLVRRVQSLADTQNAHALQRTSGGAHDLHSHKDHLGHAVPHHLEEGQFLECVHLHEHVQRLQFNLDVRYTLGDEEGGVLLVQLDARDEVDEGHFKHYFSPLYYSNI